MRDFKISFKINYSIIWRLIFNDSLRLIGSVIENNAKEMTPTY